MSNREDAKTYAIKTVIPHPKILVVDDEPKNLRILQIRLEANGYTVFTATNGQEALEQIKACRPDLILTDLQMPGMDGFEVCRRIQANQATQFIPIVMVTSLSEPEVRIKAIKAGADDSIAKPFDIVEVLARLSSLLRIKHYHDELEKVNQELQKRTAELATANQVLEEKNAELESAYGELKHTQAELVQSEKLAGLGQIVAGVAHEINNPVNFISSSLNPLERNLKVILQIFDKLDQVYQLELPQLEPLLQEVDQLAAELDYQAARSAIPKILSAMREGTTRTTQIIQSLRTFARHGGSGKAPAELHVGLDATLTLLANRFQDKITVHKDLGNLPQVECDAGQINQVFMNLLTNAIDVIEDDGEIWIATRQVDENVEIRVRDTGHGIPEDVKDKIFDPFFSTKEVGSGMGLGLWIAYQIVVEGHGGVIDVESEVGKGTEFIVTLPIQSEGMSQ
jgi:two-component system, NtrC family, sensor kinase